MTKVNEPSRARYPVARVGVAILLMALLGTAGCKPPVYTTPTMSVNPAEGTMSVNVTDMPLSRLFLQLQESEGIEVVVPDFQDRKVTLSVKNKPIDEVLRQLVARDSRYWVVSHRDDLVITGNTGEKKGGKDRFDPTQPKKSDPKREIRIDIPPGMRDIKPSSEKLAALDKFVFDSTGGKGQPDATIDLDSNKGPKKELGTVERPKGRYLNLRFAMTSDGDISFESGHLIDGTYVPRPRLAGDFVYTVSFGDDVIGVGSFEDPMVMYAHFPDSNQTHEVLTAKTGYFNLNVNVDESMLDSLMNLNLEIFRVHVAPETQELNIKTLPQYRKVMKEVFRMRGEDIRSRIQR